MVCVAMSLVVHVQTSDQTLRRKHLGAVREAEEKLAGLQAEKDKVRILCVGGKVDEDGILFIFVFSIVAVGSSEDPRDRCKGQQVCQVGAGN